MKIIFVPPKERSPQPPWRTAFIREGTIALHDGVLWRMGPGDYGSMGEKYWVRYHEGDTNA